MGELSPQAIAGRAVRGSLYNVGATSITLVLGFARSIVLARLLLPEQFGVVALALFFVTLATQMQALGLDQALIHRQDDTEQVRRTYFVLRVASGVASFVLLAAIAPLLGQFYPTMPLLAPIIVVLAGFQVGSAFVYVNETVLNKDLAFKQLALTDLIASITMTVVAPLMAYLGYGVWALVAEQGSGVVARLIANWLVFRRWSSRPGWSSSCARWFWHYGKHLWIAGGLNFLADRFDDFWVGSSLGQAQLGYYSRAYEFAHYPRRLVVNPLINVLVPTFARLQGDRLRLSQAFFRSAHLLLRANLLVSAAFGLIIPEFVAVVIGPQWSPVIRTFRLMVVYALLDGMIMLGGALVQATGHPQLVRSTFTAQVIVFIPLVIVASRWWGIDGVAVAADVMLVAGILVLYRGVRRIVDFSLFRLVFWPLAAAVVGVSLCALLEALWVAASPWLTGGAKLVVFVSLYALILLGAERGQYQQGLHWLRELVRRRE